jgi:hypothetical protein
MNRKFKNGQKVEVVGCTIRKGLYAGRFNSLCVVALDKPIKIRNEIISMLLVHPTNLYPERKNNDTK